MKRWLSVFMLCMFIGSGLGTGLVLSDAYAGDLDAFKGAKGEIKIAGGTAHIPVMKEAAKSGKPFCAKCEAARQAQAAKEQK